MTEPAVGSSDATNIETRIERDGDEYVINGTKWWSSGVGDSHCKVTIVMGKSDPTAEKHKQQSQIIVPLDAPGVKVIRMLPVFGFDDAPHGHAEVRLENVRVPATNMLLGEGRGFEIAQGRLGPGRIHHCMRTIGSAEVALEKMCKRLLSRTVFGKKIAEHSVWEERIARSPHGHRDDASALPQGGRHDGQGRQQGRAERDRHDQGRRPPRRAPIIDDAIQAHGAAGVTTDFGLAKQYASMRTMRLADGPDEVHNRAIARNEFKKYRDNEYAAKVDADKKVEGSRW
jgi:acyl-CoA dehydrogenase